MTAALATLYVVGLLGMIRLFIAQYSSEYGTSSVAASLGLLIVWPLLWVVVCLKATWILFSKGTMPE